MKLFQRLLVAPAALGLMAPMAATAAELNTNDVASYSNSGAATQSISDFSDVHPSDWAFQALNNLRQRHGCAAASPNSSMTRFEAAALLNKCLSEVAQVNEEEQLLIDEFGSELAVIRGRLDGLENDINGFEAGVFSSTTKLSGSTKFVFGAVDEGTKASAATAKNEGTTFTYDTIINLESSFSGEDLLVTSLRAGNVSAPFNATGVAPLETAFDTSQNGAEAIVINRNYYQFPVGDDFTATVGAKVRQDDMLAVWPSAYPSDSVLDVLTYAGANDAYNLALGSGAGLTYERDNFSGSFSVVSEESSDADPTSGGVWTEGGSDITTTQLAYAGEGWSVAAAYTTADGGIKDSAAANSSRYTAWGLSGVYEIDNDSQFMPSSISAGWGSKSPDKTDDNGADDTDNNSDDVEDTNTWSVGLLWNDAFSEGNTLGFAYGTAEGHRDDTSYDDPMAYEIFYSMAVSDNITVTPAIFSIEQDGNDDTIQGALVKTTFTF